VTRARRLATAVALLWLLAAAWPPGASAAVSRDQAVEIASRVPAVERALAGVRSVGGSVEVESDRYAIRFGARGRTLALVFVDVLTGRVETVYTGVKADFPLARGQASGYANRKLNAVWLWLPMTIVFVGVFFDRRRPWRLLHLDLAAIALLGISFGFYTQGKLSESVPLVYPTLIYVAARVLVAGFSPRPREGPVTWLPVRGVIVLTLLLLALRLVLVFADPFVSDIGYAGVAGADRILHGLQLYTHGGNHYDTYGPLTYWAYVPFVLVWPLHESQLYAPAAKAAAVTWELLTVAGLVALGRQTRLGWTLALAWTACPFTALALAVSSNDALVAALLVWSLVALRSRPLSGALAAGAAAAKIAPGFALPVLARGVGRLSVRGVVLFAIAAAAVLVVSLAPVVPDGGIREFYDTTIGFQLHRRSPFSIWSQHPGLHSIQSALKAASLALAFALAVFPRGRRSLAQMAALACAVLVVAELPLQHWFYLYVGWFLPLYCLALFSERAADARPAASRP